VFMFVCVRVRARARVRVRDRDYLRASAGQRECRKFSQAHVLSYIAEQRGADAAAAVWRDIRRVVRATVVAAYAAAEAGRGQEQSAYVSQS
jgi:hypothetical protein